MPSSYLVCDLDDRWTCNNCIIRYHSVARAEDSVGLAVDASWDDSAVSTSNLGGNTADRTSDGNEAGVDGGTGASNELVAASEESDGGSRLKGTGGAEGKSWEGLDWKSSVGGWAADDEWSCEGVDLIEVEWVIEWLWEWGLGERGADVGAVAGLNSQDGSCCGEVVLVGDAGSSSEVSAYSDAFQDRCEGDEASWSGDTEVVGALSNGSGAESGSEELDVGGLIGSNGLQVRVEWVWEAGGDELSLRMLA